MQWTNFTQNASYYISNIFQMKCKFNGIFNLKQNLVYILSNFVPTEKWMSILLHSVYFPDPSV